MVPEVPQALGPTADPWINSSGDTVAHPSSARGGDGPGDSKSARPLGLTTDPFGTDVPHPLAPGSRTLDPNVLDDKAVELDTTDPKPAPVVSADQTKTINGVSVTIQKDATGGSGTGAVTSFNMDAGEKPGADLDGNNKISRIDGKPKITATIQTTFATGANPNGKSAYGRGTTDEDKKNGNVTLGFHESCHRQDHQDYLKNHTLPIFGGRVGQTPDEYDKAYTAYVEAVNTYKLASDSNSFNVTDEVGNPTKSQFDKKP